MAGMKMAGGGKSIGAAKIAYICSSENAGGRIFKSVKMMHPGNAGISAGQFLAAVSDNLKASSYYVGPGTNIGYQYMNPRSDANADLITCILKHLNPLVGQTMTAVDLIYDEESILKLTKRLIKLEKNRK